MQPINYSLDVANPFQAALQGFQTGAGIQQVQQTQQDQMLKRQQEQQAMQAQQAEQARVQAIQQKYANFQGAMTPMDAIEFASTMPAPMVTALKDQFAALGAQAAKKELGNMAGLLSALRTNPEVAQQLIQQKIDAATNSGNTQEAASFQALQETAKVDPVRAFNALTPLVAALGKEGQDMLASVYGAEETAAKTGETIVKTATETEKAKTAKVEAEFAEKNVLADLKKKAADLNLTRAQTGSALAQTKKLNAEISKAALELEALKASGGIDPAKKFEQEEKIRKEWQGRNKMFNELDGIYSNLKSSADAKTGPGDIALITGFMKMLDPGSVVRETEFATARDTAGLYERLKNQAQKLNNGQIFALDSKQRKEYVDLAEQYLKSFEKKAKQEKKDLGVVVKNYRLNPENVFGVEPTTPAGGGRGTVNPPPAIEPAPAAAAQRNITVDY